MYTYASLLTPIGQCVSSPPGLDTLVCLCPIGPGLQKAGVCNTKWTEWTAPLSSYTVCIIQIVCNSAILIYLGPVVHNSLGMQVFSNVCLTNMYEALNLTTNVAHTKCVPNSILVKANVLLWVWGIPVTAVPQRSYGTRESWVLDQPDPHSKFVVKLKFKLKSQKYIRLSFTNSHLLLPFIGTPKCLHMLLIPCKLVLMKRFERFQWL